MNPLGLFASQKPNPLPAPTNPSDEWGDARHQAARVKPSPIGQRVALGPRTRPHGLRARGRV